VREHDRRADAQAAARDRSAENDGLSRLGDLGEQPLGARMQGATFFSQAQVCVPRSISLTPKLCSNSATRRDRVALDLPEKRAARLKPPWAATRLKSVRAARSTVCLKFGTTCSRYAIFSANPERLSSTSSHGAFRASPEEI